jgi:hypothetical protein
MSTTENIERRIEYRVIDRKTIYMAIIVIIVALTLPMNVKCDTGDTISSIILFALVSVFIFAGIGWWRKRGEVK